MDVTPRRSKYFWIMSFGSKNISWIPASASDAATVNPNGIKTLLATGVSTFLTNVEPILINSPKRLQRNLPDWRTFDIYIFDNFTS